MHAFCCQHRSVCPSQQQYCTPCDTQAMASEGSIARMLWTVVVVHRVLGTRVEIFRLHRLHRGARCAFLLLCGNRNPIVFILSPSLFWPNPGFVRLLQLRSSLGHTVCWRKLHLLSLCCTNTLFGQIFLQFSPCGGLICCNSHHLVI
jgi:hypothetical protein